MNREERTQIERVLLRIPRRVWNRFLASEDGQWLDRRVRTVNDALRRAMPRRRFRRSRPATEVIDALGQRLLSNELCGPWLREQILLKLPARRWSRLAKRYNDLAGKGALEFHGNMSQYGAGSAALASYWRVGGRWAKLFCEQAHLPDTLAQRRPNPLPDDEEVYPVQPMPPLHDFQLEVYSELRGLLRSGRGRTGLLSLPTGAGKTRVVVEAISDHLADHGGEPGGRNLVFWIAQSHELQQQAWECFFQLWQVPPQRADGKSICRPWALAIQRAWGSREPDEILFDDRPTIVIAGIDQLASWVRNRPDFFARIPRKRHMCTVLDEAHSAITDESRAVLLALGHRSRKTWRPRRGAPPLIGLTATPWRASDELFARLRRFFQKRLLRPDTLGDKPVRRLQAHGILARAQVEKLSIRDTPPMSAAERRRFEHFGDLPNDYLVRLGEESRRNGLIVKRLLKLPKGSSVIVFACSIIHSEMLAACLNRARRRQVAVSITTETSRSQRVASIERFRRGDLEYLVTVGVLAAGFDAPKTDVVCITRPTTSAARYEQMVGRGLRGPLNGGKPECLVLDVQDTGLPQGIQSYARVIKLWE